MEIQQSRLLPLLNPNSQRHTAGSINGTSDISSSGSENTYAPGAQNTLAEEFNSMSISTASGNWFNNTVQNTYDLRPNNRNSQPGAVSAAASAVEINSHNNSSSNALSMTPVSNFGTASFNRASIGQHSGYSPSSVSYGNTASSGRSAGGGGHHHQQQHHAYQHQQAHNHINAVVPHSVAGGSAHHGHTKYHFSSKTMNNNNVIFHHSQQHHSSSGGGSSSSHHHSQIQHHQQAVQQQQQSHHSHHHHHHHGHHHHTSHPSHHQVNMMGSAMSGVAMSPALAGGGGGAQQHNAIMSPVAAAAAAATNHSQAAAAITCFLSTDLHADVFNKSIEMFGHVAEYQQVTASLGSIPPQMSTPFQDNTYRYICPLDYNGTGTKSSVYGLVTSCYSALDTRDGLKYFLRRVHNFRPSSPKVGLFSDSWRKLTHPNLVKFKEMFTTKSFGDYSTIFVYEYLPSVTTLSQRIVATAAATSTSPRTSGTGGGGGGGNRPKILFPETLIWNYIVQLTSAMRAVFSSGLACRCIDVTKILIDSHNRLYLNGTCVPDVILFDHFNTSRNCEQNQQDDMKNLGKVTMALACGSLMALLPENYKSSYDLIYTSSQFSDDLRNFINYLFTNTSSKKTLNDIMPMIGARFYAQFEACELRCDQLETELVRQVHSSRLMRLMAKLASINERPEFNLDAAWSETGDRYLLKLFRDYVFHEVTEDGTPWLDMSHVITCLNKLDCGVDEKLMLVSRDNQNALVVTYADLRLCLENSFAELMAPTLTRGSVEVVSSAVPTAAVVGGVNGGSGDLMVAGQGQIGTQQSMPYSSAGGVMVTNPQNHAPSPAVAQGGTGDALTTAAMTQQIPSNNAVTASLSDDAANLDRHARGTILVNGIPTTAAIHIKQPQQQTVIYSGAAA